MFFIAKNIPLLRIFPDMSIQLLIRLLALVFISEGPVPCSGLDHRASIFTVRDLRDPSPDCSKQLCGVQQPICSPAVTTVHQLTFSTLQLCFFFSPSPAERCS